MFVRFWGTRGSVPTPGPFTSIYGGNTSCVEVRSDDSTVLILDCGTGVRELGLSLLREGVRRLHLLIGHTHWDHIQGFPFFSPAFQADTELNIFAPLGFRRSLEEALAGQMEYSYFPVRLGELSGHIHFTELEEGFFRIGELVIETQYMNHTAPTIGYRISHNGSTVVYTVDHEPFLNPAVTGFRHPGDQRHVDFLRDADLLIHDAQYTDEEYETRNGWGHSTIRYAVDVAQAASVRRLALTHHDPSHDDQVVARLEQQARQQAWEAGAALDIFAAREGLSLDLKGESKATPKNSVSALQRRPIAGSRVLVVSSKPSLVAEIEDMLAEDAVIVSGVPDEVSALEFAGEVKPQLVVVAPETAEGGEASLIHSVRRLTSNPELPVLVLGIQTSPADSATDYFQAPHGSPMLRSRIRAWLARTTLASPPLSSAFGDGGLYGGPDAQAPESPGVLASSEFFHSLTPSQYKVLLARSSHHVFPAGYRIVRAGDRRYGVYLVLSGRVRLSESVPDNPGEMYLSELRGGDVFGELAVLREQLRFATVVALERTSCLLIPTADFEEVLAQSPQMALGLARVLAGRLHAADRALARFGPDLLTGLPGRRAFHELYKRMAAGPRRRGTSIVLIAVDVNSLKSVNDRYGYTVGDDVLRAVGDTLVESSRGTDLVARYGPDEFVVLLVDAETQDAESVLARIRERFSSIKGRRNLPQEVQLLLRYTVSRNPPESPEALLRAANFGIQTDQPA